MLGLCDIERKGLEWTLRPKPFGKHPVMYLKLLGTTIQERAVDLLRSTQFNHNAEDSIPGLSAEGRDTLMRLRLRHQRAMDYAAMAERDYLRGIENALEERMLGE